MGFADLNLEMTARNRVSSTTAALDRTGTQSATTYATSGSMPAASKPTIIVRDVTATLI